MQTRIQKWGNSLGVRIPKPLAIEAHVAEGSVVDLTLENGGLLIQPQRAGKFALSDLVAKVNRRNIHGEVSTGAPLGRERW